MDIKSKLLQSHWTLINNTVIKAKEIYEECYRKSTVDDDSWKFDELFMFLQEEWKILYQKFVLSPIENEVLELFFRIQTGDFEKKKGLENRIDQFSVGYYLAQYFYIFIEPSLRHNYDYEDYPRFEIKNDSPNRLLYKIFEEIWDELNSENDADYGTFYDFDSEEFYDAEVNLLKVFLAKHWNDIKIKTNSKVSAILSEATGVGDHYYLDENRTLSDAEHIAIIHKK